MWTLELGMQVAPRYRVRVDKFFACTRNKWNASPVVDSASERRGNALKGSQDVDLRAKDRFWPWLFHNSCLTR